MSDENKNRITGFISENIALFVVGSILAWLAWSNHQQLDNIALKQDKAILQAQADANEKFVTKQWFSAEDGSLRAADTVNAQAISAVATSVADIKTSVAVIQEEVRRQNSVKNN